MSSFSFFLFGGGRHDSYSYSLDLDADLTRCDAWHDGDDWPGSRGVVSSFGSSPAPAMCPYVLFLSFFGVRGAPAQILVIIPFLLVGLIVSRDLLVRERYPIGLTG